MGKVAFATADARALLDSIEECLLLLSPVGEVLFANRAGAARLGGTPESLARRFLWDLLPPEAAHVFREGVGRALASAKPVDCEDRRGGRYYRIHIHPLLEGSPARGLAVHVQDVTEARRLAGIERLLREADERLLAGTPAAASLTRLMSAAAELLDLELLWLGRREKDGTVSLMAWGGPGQAFADAVSAMGMRWDEGATSHGPTAVAIRTGRPVTMDVQDPGFAPWREAGQRHGLRAGLSLPLIVHGEVFGALTAYTRHPDAWEDAGLIAILEHLAQRTTVILAAALEHERLRLLSAAMAHAANAIFITDRRGVIQWVNEAFCRLSGYSAEEAIGQTPRLLKSGVQGAEYYQQLWSTILAGQPFVSDIVDRRKDGSLYTVRQIITPIRREDGEISHFIATHEDISAAVAAREAMERMAHYDSLTGLPNRSLFYDRLAQALALARRQRERLALLFVDLDRFKPVNDQYGHTVGDALLVEVAKRLSRCVRESDTVARIAGDEFTVILTGIEDPRDAAVVAEKIVARLCEPFLVQDHRLEIGASIGIALYPDDGTDEDSLLARADDAMYAAKHAGRGTYRFARTPPS